VTKNVQEIEQPNTGRNTQRAKRIFLKLNSFTNNNNINFKLYINCPEKEQRKEAKAQREQTRNKTKILNRSICFLHPTKSNN